LNQLFHFTGTHVRKRIFLLTAVLIFGFAGYLIYRHVFPTGPVNGNHPRGSIPVAVEIAGIEKSDILDIRYFSGTLYPVSQFIVAPKISGRLKDLPVNIGDTIQPGQIIAILDDEEYQQQVDQAQAEVEVALANLEESRSNLTISQRELKRTQILRKKKIASESELDAATAQYKTKLAGLKVSRAQFAQKEAALEIAQVRLSYLQIRLPKENNPGNWVVGERFVHRGALLSPGTPIVSILDIRSLLAVVYVVERDYARVQPGMPAEITTDVFPERIFKGNIQRIAPMLKETSRKARVEIEIPNPDELLKPGMFIRTWIEFDKHRNATIIPLSALVKRDNVQGIFSADMKEMKVRFIPVATGIVDEKRAEILTPQLSGFVVTLGHHLLQDGSTIIVTDKIAGPASERTGIEKNRKKGPKTDKGKTQ